MSEASSNPEYSYPLSGDFIDAKQCFDRRDIELEAQVLIEECSNSPEIPVYFPERYDNARTALFEALTASGHLSRIELHGNLQEINAQVLRRLLNGINPLLPKHEQERRFQELCNELVIQKIFTAISDGAMPESTAILEVSDYPEEMGEAATHIGYRQQNKKGMVRSTHLIRHPDGTCTRLIEQISRSNGDAHTTAQLLQSFGIAITGHKAKDVEVLGTPLLYDSTSLTEGVISMQRLLDQFSGPTIQYGDIKGTNPQHAPYEEVREESLRREQQLEFYVRRLADFEERADRAVAQGLLNSEQKTSQYKREIQAILRSICELAPVYAEDCFGPEAAQVYDEISYHLLSGELEQLESLRTTAQALEKAITFCGITISAEKAKELGVEPDTVGELTAQAKESWKWKRGTCRVQNCPSPRPTEVGPCSVCRHCQHQFDQGKDPTKTYGIISYMKKSNAKNKEFSLLGANFNLAA